MQSCHFGCLDSCIEAIFVCHQVNNFFLYMGFFRFKGARVPHRLCIKGWHPLREGVTGATRVPPTGDPPTGDPPQPSLFREGVLSLFSAYSIHCVLHSLRVRNKNNLLAKGIIGGAKFSREFVTSDDSLQGFR